jgi:hypothetical protein
MLNATDFAVAEMPHRAVPSHAGWCGIRGGEFKRSSKRLQRMLRDVSGRLRTPRNLLILKHPEKSRSVRCSLGADGRRFDPGRPDQAFLARAPFDPLQ